MRIKIFPPLGMKLKNVDDRSWIEMEDGSTLRQTLRKAGVNPALAKIFMVRVNSEPAEMSMILRDGDMIGFIAFITGG